MKESLNLQLNGLENFNTKVIEVPIIAGVVEVSNFRPEGQVNPVKVKESELVFQAEQVDGKVEREMVVPEVVQPGMWGRVKEGVRKNFEKTGKFVEKHKLELGVTAIAGTTMACNVFGREITDGNFIAAIVNTLVWPVVGKAFVGKDKAGGVEAVMAIVGAGVGFVEPWTGVVTGILAGVVGSGHILFKLFGNGKS